MSRKRDPSQLADETVTVRLPKGTAAKLRAATGQPFSRLVRFTVMALLEKHTGQSALTDTRVEVSEIVKTSPEV
jgi:hypothetical protein